MAHTGKAFVNWKAKEKKLEDEKEVRIQGALQELMARKPKVTSVAAVACHYNVPYDALYSWHKYKHKSHSKAQVDQQLLTKAQEETLSMWIKYMGMRGQPISKQSLHIKVSEISRVLQEKERKTGKQQLPGKNWVYVLLDHYPGLSLKWLTGLDPLCAQNFNPTVVSQHFKLLGDFLRTYDIPWDNIYNMDKKGIQLGGGRRLTAPSIYIHKNKRHGWRYKAQTLNSLWLSSVSLQMVLFWSQGLCSAGNMSSTMDTLRRRGSCELPIPHQTKGTCLPCLQCHIVQQGFDE